MKRERYFLSEISKEKIMAKVDIVITTYRNHEKLKICLNSVIERTKFVDYKIYLWANDPNDEIKKVIHEAMFLDGILYTDKIEPIFNDSNDGTFSSNNNECAAEGNSEYILFLNDDVEAIKDDWLYSMSRILDSDQKVGAVGALLLYPGAKSVQHCGVMFDQRTGGLPYHIYYKQPPSQFMAVDRYYQAVTGACILVRREDFNKLSGFDTAYRYGYEDISYCLDLKHKLQKNSVYCSSAQLIHHEGVSGSFKAHPHLKNNMKVFKDKWAAKIFNDHQFYLQNPNFMIYKCKANQTPGDEH
jgi:GT2 family glycosyltransferase